MIEAVLDLFPESAAFADGGLTIGGIRATELADEFGTPLVVYCERTLRSQARAYREAAPDALVVYGSKAFPNLALLRLFAEEGLGADVSTLGELELARRAEIPGERLVVHGNNKSDEELRAAAEAERGARRARRAGRGRACGRGRSAPRPRPRDGRHRGGHARVDPHRAPRLEVRPPAGRGARRAAPGQAAGLDAAGLHVHIGSQLLDTQAARMTVEWLAAFAADCRAELGGWEPAVVDLGGGLGVRHVPDEQAPSVEDFVGELLRRLEHAWELHGLRRPLVVLEPGRSLVGRAGVALYRVGAVKRASETTTYVAVDGGMSDNPRPQLYGARYTAVIADRPEAPAEHAYTVSGKNCEEEVLVRRVLLPEPRRGDVLADSGRGRVHAGDELELQPAPPPGGCARRRRRRPADQAPGDAGRRARAGRAVSRQT